MTNVVNITSLTDCLALLSVLASYCYYLITSDLIYRRNKKNIHEGYYKYADSNRFLEVFLCFLISKCMIEKRKGMVLLLSLMSTYIFVDAFGAFSLVQYVSKQITLFYFKSFDIQMVYTILIS